MNLSRVARREFLLQAATLATAAALPAAISSPLRAQGPAGSKLPRPAASITEKGGAVSTIGARPITFGYSLYGMKTIELERALKTCKEIGYDAVELASMRDWPGDPDTWSAERRRTFRQQLADNGLTLGAIMDSLPPQANDAQHQAQLERLKRVTAFARELSPERPPVVETILGGKPGEWEQLKTMMAARLTDWARVAEQQQIVVAVKPHRFGALNTPADAVWLMEHVDGRWIGIGYDYSHFVLRDMPIAETLKTLLPYIAFVHVKDAVMRDGKAQFVLPGETGLIDYGALFTQLADSDFVGCVCVEISGQVQGQPGYDPIAAARKSFENLEPALEKAGLR